MANDKDAKKTILYVSSTKTYSHVTIGLIEDLLGYNVNWVSECDEAMEHINENGIDGVIVEPFKLVAKSTVKQKDPFYNALDLVKRIKSANPDLYVSVFSKSYFEEGMENQFKSLGADYTVELRKYDAEKFLNNLETGVKQIQ